MKIAEGIFDSLKKLGIRSANLGCYLSDNLGMDSQEIVELIVLLEKTFCISLDISDIKRNMTVLDVVNLIESKINTVNFVKNDVC